MGLVTLQFRMPLTLATTSTCRLRGATRTFSTTRRCSDHYTTLGVSRNAPKAQIKSHYYQLSKKHHPDISKDPESAGIFSAASEAYSVLIDDRQRRAYDRSLLSRPSSSHTSYNPRAPSSGPGSRSGYAWEYRPRSAGFKKPQPDYAYTPPHSRPQTETASGPARHSPPPGAYHDLLRGSRKRKEEAEKEMDRLRNSSSMWRAFQVLVALSASLTVIGGIGT